MPWSHTLLVEVSTRPAGWFPGPRDPSAEEAIANLAVYISCTFLLENPPRSSYLTHVQTKSRLCLYLASGDLSELCSSKHFLVITSLYSSHTGLLSVSWEPSNFLHWEYCTLFHCLKNRSLLQNVSRCAMPSKPRHHMSASTLGNNSNKTAWANTYWALTINSWLSVSMDPHPWFQPTTDKNIQNKKKV